MPYKDKGKQRQAQRRSYVRNKKRHQLITNQRRSERRISLKQMVREAKGFPCADCGKPYPYYVMDLDHVRGEKFGDISTMVHETVPVQILLDEIAKCEVVCSNCHRIRTFTRMDNPKVGDGAPLERE